MPSQYSSDLQLKVDFAVDAPTTPALSDVWRNAIPWILGLALLPLLALTWSGDPAVADRTASLRALTPTILLSEFLVILVALRSRINWAELYRPSLLIPLFLLVLLCNMTSMLVASDTDRAFSKNMEYLLHILLFVSIFVLVPRGLSQRSVINAYIIGFWTFVAGVAGFAIFVPKLDGFSWIDDLPAASNIRHYGYYAVAVAALAIGNMVAKEGSARRRAGWYATIALAVGFAGWTGSRGALYSIAIAICVSPILLPYFRNLKYAKHAISAFGIGIVIAATLPVPDPQMGITRSFKTAAEINSGRFTTGRYELWTQAAAAIADRPVFGHGTNQFKPVIVGSKMAQPHNVLLQVAFDWGIVGLGLFLWMAAIICWRTLMRLRTLGPEYAGPALLIIGLGVFSAVDGTFYRSLPLSMIAVAFGFIWAKTSGGSPDKALPTR